MNLFSTIIDVAIVGYIRRKGKKGLQSCTKEI